MPRAQTCWAGAGGDVYAETVNLEWQPFSAARLRSELRYDVHVGPGDLFDNFTRDQQLTGVLDLVVLF